MRAASHPPVWIHRKCELQSLKKMLNGTKVLTSYKLSSILPYDFLSLAVNQGGALSRDGALWRYFTVVPTNLRSINLHPSNLKDSGAESSNEGNGCATKMCTGYVPWRQRISNVTG